jgi:hypothetical protein
MCADFQVLERKVEWQNIEAVLKETNKVLVHDILTEMEEELDFRWASCISMLSFLDGVIFVQGVKCMTY